MLMMRKFVFLSICTIAWSGKIRNDTDIYVHVCSSLNKLQEIFVSPLSNFDKNPMRWNLIIFCLQRSIKFDLQRNIIGVIISEVSSFMTSVHFRVVVMKRNQLFSHSKFLNKDFHSLE